MIPSKLLDSGCRRGSPGMYDMFRFLNTRVWAWVIGQTGIKSLWGYIDFESLSVRSPRSIPEYYEYNALSRVVSLEEKNVPPPYLAR